MRDVILYMTDTMTDWEYGYLTVGLAAAEDAAPGRFRLRQLADNQTQVTTKGGFRVLAEGDIGEVDEDNLAMLVLPGADTWFRGHQRVLDLTRRLVDRGTPVAGICGGTAGLARAGVLDDRAHTSNAPEFLTPTGYTGAEHYREERVVDADGVITAPATMPVDFAAAIFRRTEMLPASILDPWYGLFTTGERTYFEQLVQAGG